MIFWLPCICQGRGTLEQTAAEFPSLNSFITQSLSWGLAEYGGLSVSQVDPPMESCSGELLLSLLTVDTKSWEAICPDDVNVDTTISGRGRWHPKEGWLKIAMVLENPHYRDWQITPTRNWGSELVATSTKEPSKTKLKYCSSWDSKGITHHYATMHMKQPSCNWKVVAITMSLFHFFGFQAQRRDGCGPSAVGLSFTTCASKFDGSPVSQSFSAGFCSCFPFPTLGKRFCNL